MTRGQPTSTCRSTKPDSCCPSGRQGRGLGRGWEGGREGNRGAAEACGPVGGSGGRAVQRRCGCRGNGTTQLPLPCCTAPCCTAPALPVQRLIIRSSYVVLLTVVAICMPFYPVVVGQVGRCGGRARRARGTGGRGARGRGDAIAAGRQRTGAAASCQGQGSEAPHTPCPPHSPRPSTPAACASGRCPSPSPPSCGPRWVPAGCGTGSRAAAAIVRSGGSRRAPAAGHPMLPAPAWALPQGPTSARVFRPRFVRPSPPCPPCAPAQVYRPRGWTLRALVAVNTFMLAVCLGAVVGSVQSLADQWSSFQFFA